MAALTYLDTHVAAWLYAGLDGLLSKTARRAIDHGELWVSPAVLLELQYLFETKRTTEPGTTVIDALSRQIGVQMCGVAFADVVHRALDERWTRDPFDRLIVAQAAVREGVLVSKDRTIRRHYTRAVW